MFEYLLERATARWQVWLILSPSPLVFVVMGLTTLGVARQRLLLDDAVGVTLGVLVALCLFGIAVYLSTRIVGRAARMFPGERRTRRDSG